MMREWCNELPVCVITYSIKCTLLAWGGNGQGNGIMVAIAASRKPVDTDLSLLELALLNAVELDTLLVNMFQMRSCVQMNDHTTVAILSNSLSAVTGADCTRNLSLHLASGAGSSFMA